MAASQPPVLFDEILDFLASMPTAAQIIAFEPPEALQERLSYLLEQNRQDAISPDERDELNEFLRMNRLMSRLKLRVSQKTDKL